MSPTKPLANLLLANDSTGVTHVPGFMCYLCTRFVPLQLHSAIHVVVENQLAERIAVVQETLERLLAEGLDRHEAIHAIGSVVTEHLWKAMNETLRGPDLEEGYFRRLEALTASEWLEGAG